MKLAMATSTMPSRIEEPWTLGWIRDKGKLVSAVDFPHFLDARLAFLTRDPLAPGRIRI
jgi:hypothetical protein